MHVNVATFATLDHKVDRVIGTIVVVALGAMLAIVTFQIVSRNVFHAGFSGTDELARYLMIIFSFLAGSMALRRNELIGIRFVINSLPARVGRWCELLGYVGVVVFLLLAIGYGTQLGIFILERGQLSPGLQIPVGIIYLSIPLAFLLQLFTSLISIYDLLTTCSLARHLKYATRKT